MKASVGRWRRFALFFLFVHRSSSPGRSTISPDRDPPPQTPLRCPAGHANAVVVLVKPVRIATTIFPQQPTGLAPPDLAIMVVCLVGVCAFTPGVLLCRPRLWLAFSPLRLAWAGAPGLRAVRPTSCRKPLPHANSHLSPDGWADRSLRRCDMGRWRRPLTAPRPTRLRPARCRHLSV
jgi:hypothetical protein